MSKPKYLLFNKQQMQSIIDNSESMEEVLIAMNYSSPRDKRFISCIRNYCDTLSIKHQHLRDLILVDLIQCNCCKKEKPYSDFYFSNGKLSQKVCKDCVRSKQKIKYHNRQEELNFFKSQHPCQKCGCDKFYLIDFHHLDPSKKDFSISENTNAKLETLMKEIDKCVSLCSNCHREFHYLEREQNITIEDYLNGVVE